MAIGECLDGDTLDAVDADVARGRGKFPDSRFTLTALGEEFGELCRAFLQKQGRDRVRAEALQVAAVALRIYEESDTIYELLTDAEAKP